MGKHRRLRRPCHAPFQSQDEPQVQNDIQHSRNRQENQRYNGIAHRPQKRREKIMQERGGNAEEDHAQVFPHRPPHLLRHPEQGSDRVQADKGKTRQQQRRACDEYKRGTHALLQAGLVPLSKANGKQCPAAHAQSQQNRGQEGHQGKGGAHSGQGVLPQALSNDQGIRNIVALLQQVSQNHRDREKQHGPHHRSLCQIFVHALTHIGKFKLVFRSYCSNVWYRRQSFGGQIANKQKKKP